MNNNEAPMDRTAIRITRIGEGENAFLYWQSRPAIERLQALERIRREYHNEVDDPEFGLERVIRIGKRPSPTT